MQTKERMTQNTFRASIAHRNAPRVVKRCEFLHSILILTVQVMSFPAHCFFGAKTEIFSRGRTLDQQPAITDPTIDFVCF